MNGWVGGAGPCIGLLEMASVAHGLEATDALRKEADVELLASRTVSPGKWLVLFSGSVEDTTSALRRGTEVGTETLIDSLLIPNVEPTLLELVRHAEGGLVTCAALHEGRGSSAGGMLLDAIGVIETLSVAATIRAADVASKTGTLRLVSLHLAVGLGGKSYVTFTGEVSDVEAGVERGATDAEQAGMLVRRVVIPRPHADMHRVLGL